MKSRRKRAFTKLAIWGGVLVLFLVLVFGAYRASSGSSEAPLKFNNGTVNFAATTILISLDGFRADFLNRGLTPTLNAFVQDGVSPKFMNPSFPSLTFPNHYTLATGLYPEAHGIVGNTFWDPMFKEEFYYTHPAHSMQPKWWGGEPIWETAERQGMRSAIHMWPGSEAHIGGVEPAYVDKFNGSEQLSVKVRRILQLLDLPGPDMPTALANSPRPQLIAAYVPNVDSDGHKYGPNSTEIRTTIQQVDTMLGDLFHGLEQRNLTKIVNVIVVSDHGMATTSVDRLIQLDDLVDPGLLEHVDGWPLYGLRPKNPADLEGMHRQILAKTKDNPNVEVYLRDKDMPERYHFTQNDRIAPLWLVPKAGWAITKREDFDIEQAKKDGVEYSPRGLHGYDHEHPLMRAIFVARGPAFPHQPGSRVDPFRKHHLSIYEAAHLLTVTREHRSVQHRLRLARPRAPAEQRHHPPASQARRSPRRSYSRTRNSRGPADVLVAGQGREHAVEHGCHLDRPDGERFSHQRPGRHADGPIHRSLPEQQPARSWSYPDLRRTALVSHRRA